MGYATSKLTLDTTKRMPGPNQLQMPTIDRFEECCSGYYGVSR
jgi:hypothetical protein